MSIHVLSSGIIDPTTITRFCCNLMLEIGKVWNGLDYVCYIALASMPKYPIRRVACRIKYPLTPMRIIIIGAFMFVSASVQAQIGVPVAPLVPSSIEQYERFRLYTSCAPVALLVEGLPTNATEIGLFEDDILTTVRSRLRGARIYSSEAMHGPYLYVNVNVAGLSFNISVELRKPVTDLETELTSPATTWNTGTTGTHGQESDYILQAIGRLMDIFIDEYLAVNESACK